MTTKPKPAPKPKPEVVPVPAPMPGTGNQRGVCACCGNPIDAERCEVCGNGVRR